MKEKNHSFRSFECPWMLWGRAGRWAVVRVVGWGWLTNPSIALLNRYVAFCSFILAWALFMLSSSCVAAHGLSKFSNDFVLMRWESIWRVPFAILSSDRMLFPSLSRCFSGYCFINSWFQETALFAVRRYLLFGLYSKIIVHERGKVLS